MKKRARTARLPFLSDMTERVLSGKHITGAEARRLIALQQHEDIMLLLACANMIRQRQHGSRIELCSIINARSGRCSEDCAFCAQSAHYHTRIRAYPLMQPDAILRAARDAKKKGAARFSIVTSGRGVADRKAFKKIRDIVGALAKLRGISPCASLGILSREQFRELKSAGLRRYHHNLETARSFFTAVCSTHTYQDRVSTVVAAREAGLEVCCGGIFGLGETPAQRIELALFLRDIGVDSVPLNFLNPIAGTPLAVREPVAPLEILKTIALYRFVLPSREIRVCGGRETALRTLQPFMYMAGANGTMIGNYLTTEGRSPALDIQEINDLMLTKDI